MSRNWEREILSEVLFSEGQLGRHELLAFLQSKKGQEAWTTEDERKVYVAFKESSPSKDTKNIVEAILAFEAMAKLLHDAFHQVLSKVEQGSLVKTKQLLSLTAVSLAAREVGGRYQEVLETMSGAGMEAERLRIEGSFAEFGSLDGDAEVFLDAMIHHHQDVQKSKGRNGKQAWIRRSEDDRWYADVLGVGTSRGRDQRVRSPVSHSPPHVVPPNPGSCLRLKRLNGGDFPPGQGKPWGA